ncbi:uncharacterized protein LOC116199733 [Punica granatum]|uniref:Uncharacterized protein LOC116199733 n=1 Tax=Punica granatum TaxID=22663 RepID=A0A218VYF5_PUNGR|nr:uncharacterized protein LOC116199733 [Punica granatum]OWM65617.1 hypothetical protein CDL15_Pgr017114 [Punica granatum]
MGFVPSAKKVEKVVEGAEGSRRRRRAAVAINNELNDIVFSWSIEDISNENLYKNQVGEIPERFPSVENYLGSFVYPLLEETRAEICSGMEAISTLPYARVMRFEECKPYGKNFYEVTVDFWRNRSCKGGKEPYKMLTRDVLILTDSVPETVSDLQRMGRICAFASVSKISDDKSEGDFASVYFKVVTGKKLGDINLKQRKLFAILVGVNLTTNIRIWTALHLSRNWNVQKEVLCTDFSGEEECSLCTVQSDDFCKENLTGKLLNDLNESQAEAILTCLRKIRCQHKPVLELIWGPPGTGKTKATAIMLLSLLRLKCRTVVCAPTNVSVIEIASRVVHLMRGSASLGDLLLFGNKERLKVEGLEVEDICLHNRVDRITECTAPTTGWKYCISSAITFLSDPLSQYNIYSRDDLGKRKLLLEFLRERFLYIVKPLERCLSTLRTQICASYVPKHIAHEITELLGHLESFSDLLSGKNLVFFSQRWEESFSCRSKDKCLSEALTDPLSTLYLKRSECLDALKSVRDSLNRLQIPSFKSVDEIKEFCFQSASLIFCTVSKTFTLHSLDMKPPQLLVIDEAAQLKECESVIPLQLLGLRHAILIGDERQLPAVVKSDVSKEARFGRSLFERLSSLGKLKHPLNVQYRMHPSISCFPNQTFYGGQIRDGPNVKHESYSKQYLPGLMFGSFSFINVSEGREERGVDGSSLTNPVEADVAAQILSNLYKAWSLSSKENLSVGIISPYGAQVGEISERLGKKYEYSDGFTVAVNTVDGFQGREQDIVILSTVRSNHWGSIGFLAKPNRTNVALTRARYCLWILGNQRTLRGSSTVWEALVYYAIDRQCFFNADDDEGLAKTILEAKTKYNQLDDLLTSSNVLFRDAKWKVIFDENFRQSFRKLTSRRTRSSVMNLLMKLSSGWRPKRKDVDLICKSSSQIIKQFKAENLSILCTVDIEKESEYTQILKIWDVLPFEDIAKTIEHLDGIYMRFSYQYVSRCKEKRFDGDLQVPISWETPFDFLRRGDSLGENSKGTPDSQLYTERSKVKDSLLLMKFYSRSSGIINHLLSDRDGNEVELPFDLTKEQREIIQFPQSTFILGRSGTGKTTVLTMKLLQREQLHRIATSDYRITGGANSGREDSEEMLEEESKYVLRQLFVTVSSKLCFAVKQQLSQLKSFTCEGNFFAEGSSTDVDFTNKADQFEDIADSFIDIPHKSFPLVITFSKFLMMLDGSIGFSYFEKFPRSRDICREKVGAARSLALQAFIQEKEVNYEKFCAVYWRHFNERLTRNLDPSRVFTEIISHIKGSLQVGNSCSGRLSRTDYVSLSDGRGSHLTQKERHKVYDVFLEYEKKKLERGEFDLSDVVNDLHSRLRCKKIRGDDMDYVYIDEVQDLTMRQIGLFKYVSHNVEEGFVFSGDTAQTIGRGIDFKFEDVRRLFYNDFMQETEGGGKISKIYQLSQNFRTHSGILKLAQSVTDLLCHFFPLFVDVLRQETSHICGESPIFLELEMNQNSVASIFGEGGNVAGLGPEQVIIVRDDCAREEVLGRFGKQALVLALTECKGLEFQDVVLYNFFGSSPMKNQWRVVYEYMKGRKLLDNSFIGHYPQFKPARHNILCSELKQLYVAITRARQRLWICENNGQFAGAMLDYWRKLSLIQYKTEKLNSCRQNAYTRA